MSQNADNYNSPLLTESIVREFMEDRDTDTTLLDTDGRTWTEKDIRAAMVRAVQMWNNTPPHTIRIKNPLYPPNTYTMLLGTQIQLLQARLNNYIRNDIDYSTGGTQASPFKARIKHFKTLLAELKPEFQNLASMEKQQKNLSRAWRVL